MTKTPRKKPTPVLRSIVSAIPLSFHWRNHDGSRKRVWQNTWFGDQFEILTILEFQQLNSICKRFSIPLIEAEDD